MDDTGDSTLAQRNGNANANARCEWALMNELRTISQFELHGTTATLGLCGMCLHPCRV